MENKEYRVGDKVTLLVDRKQNKLFAGDKCIVICRSSNSKYFHIRKNTGKEKLTTMVSNDDVELTK